MVFQYRYFKLLNDFNCGFHFLNVGFSISFFVVFNIFICVFQYLQFPHLWFQFLHLWFWISLFVVSISSFVIFNIFNFFICGFSIFFSTDLPTFLSFFTLLSFWNLPYRLFQFYNSGTDIFMTLPCFFYRSTAFFDRSTAFFRPPYRVFFDRPTRSVDRLYFPWYEPISKTYPPAKMSARKGMKTATEIPVGQIRSNHLTQKWTNTNSGPSEELKAGQECIWS